MSDHKHGASLSEFIVELLVVLDAPDAAAAEKVGERFAARLMKTAHVKNVLVADVRSEEDA